MLLKAIFTLLFIQGALLEAGHDKPRLHTVVALDSVDASHADEKFEEALTLVDTFLENATTDYEKAWALLKKGTILTRLKQPGPALAIYADITQNYLAADASGILESAIYYESSKALSKLGEHQSAVEALELALAIAAESSFPNYDKDFRLEQMAIRRGRYLFLAGQRNEGLQSLHTTIARLEALLPEKSAEIQRHITCEISVAYRDMTDLYAHQKEFSLALASCTQALAWAEKDSKVDHDHLWRQQLRDRLQELSALNQL